MLRVRSCVVSQILSPVSHLYRLLSASAPPVSHLHRLLSASAPPVSPNPGFAVEDYLVDTCGLTRAQALKATTKLSHLKSPAKPDAVLAFLTGLGLSNADVAATVVKDPKLLCAGVERTLAPKVAELTGLGLSHSEIVRLVSLSGAYFRHTSFISKLQYYLPFFGSFDNFLQTVKRSPYLLSFDLERTVKPNVALLRECGLGACDIAKLFIAAPRMLITKQERVQAMVTCAEALGVPRGSGMFKRALQAVAFLTEEKITAKLDYLKKTFRWSDAEVRFAVARAPTLLQISKDMLRSRSEFLISEVGLEPVDIAHQPVIICLSLEGRLRPRHYVLKFLKENGFIDRDRSFPTAVTKTDEVFMQKYICPHKEVAPHLAEDYATACRGEVPTNFKFT